MNYSHVSRLQSSPEARTNALALLLCLAALKLVLHLALNGRYGYHRDELYFLACADHLDFGYVDHSPLVPWIAFASRTALGDSLFALRFIPALAGAFTVLLTGVIARELGASRFAQALAAMSIIIAPVYLRAQNMLHIPTFEPLFWGGCAYLIVRIIKYERPKLWLWVGVLAGLGLQNKPTMVFFGVGLAAGLLLTSARKHLTSKWLWAGGALAFLIFLPNLIWQATHDWPTVAFATNLNKTTMSRISPIEFMLGQVLYINPLNAPIWIAGLVFYFRSDSGKPFRLLGWIYVTVLVLLVVAKSKIYYLAPAYPMLLAAGAVMIEQKLAGLAWARATVLGAVVAGGLVLAPVGLPIVPITRVDAYITTFTLGVIRNAREVTQDYHDEFGWENQAATVASVFHALPAEEQGDCIILAGNYGEAGAIDFYRGKYDLPRAVSTHMTYFMWGPGERSGNCVVAFGVPKVQLDILFGRVEQKSTIQSANAVPFETNLPVYVCHEPKLNLHEVWEKHGPSL